MTLAVVQARVSSNRLPGKVLAEINGKPMIAHLLSRLSKAESLDEIIVATGPGAENEPLRYVVESEGFECPYIECDEDDVLTRYVLAAEEYGADTIVRVTGDCPLIDWEIVDKVVDALGGHEFATNVLERTYAKGMDTEVMTLETLYAVDTICQDDRREHVTLYIYDEPDIFNIASVKDVDDHSDLTLCVDYPEDLDLVRDVFAWMGRREMPYRDILKFVQERYGPTADRISSRERCPSGDHRTVN